MRNNLFFLLLFILFISHWQTAAARVPAVTFSQLPKLDRYVVYPDPLSKLKERCPDLRLDNLAAMSAINSRYLLLNTYDSLIGHYLPVIYDRQKNNYQPIWYQESRENDQRDWIAAISFDSKDFLALTTVEEDCSTIARRYDSTAPSWKPLTEQRNTQALYGNKNCQYFQVPAGSHKFTLHSDCNSLQETVIDAEYEQFMFSSSGNRFTGIPMFNGQMLIVHEKKTIGTQSSMTYIDCFKNSMHLAGLPKDGYRGLFLTFPNSKPCLMQPALDPNNCAINFISYSQNFTECPYPLPDNPEALKQSYRDSSGYYIFSLLSDETGKLKTYVHSDNLSHQWLYQGYYIQGSEEFCVPPNTQTVSPAVTEPAPHGYLIQMFPELKNYAFESNQTLVSHVREVQNNNGQCQALISIVGKNDNKILSPVLGTYDIPCHSPETGDRSDDYCYPPSNPSPNIPVIISASVSSCLICILCIIMSVTHKYLFNSHPGYLAIP